jgi:glycine cleavage system regulatory protein
MGFSIREIRPGSKCGGDLSIVKPTAKKDRSGGESDRVSGLDRLREKLLHCLETKTSKEKVMKTHAVLSALGRDRVGVADDLAAELAKRRLDIEDSRMTTLRGHSALIVHVCGERDNVTHLSEDLGRLGKSLGFHLQLEPVEPARPKSKERQFMLEAFSPGQPGIGAVTAVLKRHDINIEDLETDATSASWTSKIAFQLKARITIPASYSFAGLREELRDLEHERNLDIVIKPLPTLVDD